MQEKQKSNLLVKLVSILNSGILNTSSAEALNKKSTSEFKIICLETIKQLN